MQATEPVPGKPWFQSADVLQLYVPDAVAVQVVVHVGGVKAVAGAAGRAAIAATDRTPPMSVVDTTALNIVRPRFFIVQVPFAERDQVVLPPLRDGNKNAFDLSGSSANATHIIHLGWALSIPSYGYFV